MRCDPKNDITLDALVGRLTTFELDNFDNYVPNSSNLESTFQKKLSLKKKVTKSKSKNSDSEDEDGSSDDLEFIEALLARRFPKGKGKYKGKIPLIFFSCEEVGHIATRCPNREGKEENKNENYKGKKDFKSYKDYKDKGKKSYYMAKDSDSSEEDEIVYIATKDESDDENDKMSLIYHVSKNDTWIFDSGCSHHMTGEKFKFEHLEHYDGGSVRFGNDEPCYVKRKGCIALSNDLKCDNSYWAEGLKHNLLSVA